MNAIETLGEFGLVAKLYPDDDPMSPKEWDQVGILVTWHRRYCFDVDGSKEFGDPSDFMRRAKQEDWIILPVSMIDHSGISLYEGSGAHQMDPGGWDSGQIGWIYTSKERFDKIHGAVRYWRKRAVECLRQELQTWDQYVTWDVYGYTIETEDGDHVGSCHGLYGRDYAMQEMTSSLKHAVDSAKAAERLEQSCFAL